MAREAHGTFGSDVRADDSSAPSELTREMSTERSKPCLEPRGLYLGVMRGHL